MTTLPINEIAFPLVEQNIDAQINRRIINLIITGVTYSHLESIANNFAKDCEKTLNIKPLVVNDEKHLKELSPEYLESIRIIVAYPRPLEELESDSEVTGSNTKYMRRGLENMRLMKQLARVSEHVLVVLFQDGRLIEPSNNNIPKTTMGVQSLYLSPVVRMFTDGKVLNLRDRTIAN